MMKKLLGWLLHPLLWILLGFIALALVIWFGGPLLAIDKWHPLESEFARSVAIAIVALAWLGKKVFDFARRKWRNNRLAEGLMRSPAPSAEAPKPGASEVELLDRRFAEAIDILRQVRISAAGRRPRLIDLLALSRRQFLYELPWYLFIGAPGSGKTTALVGSGLHFPLAQKFGTERIQGVGGTRNCDWWFTDEAVFLDTAGRYTTQESDREADAGAWTGFLQLLKKSRPRCPINGVMLVVSATDLLQESAVERELHVQSVRARLQELHEVLQNRFPIYVLITKSDLIAGFDEYFATMSKDERAQVWGFTYPCQNGADPTEARGFTNEFDALQTRLIDGVPDRMQAELDPARRAAIHAFPQQFGQLKPLISQFLEQVFGSSRFEEAALLRGVYFTSGKQEGTPIDRIMGGLARRLGLQRQLIAPPASSARSYFLTDLLRQVIIGEQGLAGTNLRHERRRNLFKSGAYVTATLLLIGAAALWLLGYQRNRAYVEDVQARLPALQQQVNSLAPSTGLTDVASLLPLLQAVHDLAASKEGTSQGPALLGGFGLDQRDKLASAARDAYEKLLRDALLPRLSNRIAEQLHGANGGDLEYAYDVLRLYLMLFDGRHFDAHALAQGIRDDWKPRLSVDQNAALARHLQALLAQGHLTNPVAVDENLIGRARASLARAPLASRVYSRIKRDGDITRLPEFSLVKEAGAAASFVFARASGVPLTQGVPGLYTFDGYHTAFLPKARTITPVMAEEERWVLGLQGQPNASQSTSPDPALLTEEVKRLYLNDYARIWESFIADVGLARASDLTQSIQIARLLSAPDSPLIPFLRAASYETTLVPKKEGDESLIDRATAQWKETTGAAVKRYTSTQAPVAVPASDKPIESIVDDRFDALRRLVTQAAPGQPTPIDATIARLNEVYTTANAIDTAIRSKVKPPPPDVLLSARSEAARLPEPVRTMVQDLAKTIEGQMGLAIGANLSDEVRTTIGEFCRRAIEGRYPFSTSSQLDVLPDDFARLFAPGGLFDDFFKQRLADKVDTSSRNWSFKRINDVPFGNNGNLAAFQRAQVIRDVFFRSGGNVASLRLEFKPIEMDASTTLFLLDVDGQHVRYNHGPQVPQSVQWPGPRGSTQVRLQVQPPASSGSSGETTEGPWALFRMFDKVQFQPTAAPERFRASFDVDGRKAVFDVVASSVVNPFRLRELQSFKCPTGL